MISKLRIGNTIYTTVNGHHFVSEETKYLSKCCFWFFGTSGFGAKVQEETKDDVINESFQSEVILSLVTPNPHPTYPLRTPYLSGICINEPSTTTTTTTTKTTTTTRTTVLKCELKQKGFYCVINVFLRCEKEKWFICLFLHNEWKRRNNAQPSLLNLSTLSSLSL